ncbi:hypothetical protein PCANB_001986 [Pneumocystis canis]|nr:hypothetical protein PCK1_001736 [Pneumocystis canis]KAG5439412.1 hypothetical protein PCANB_001986 [Pneumocystis canis]
MNIQELISCIFAFLRPSLLVPHITVESFAHLPNHLSNALKKSIKPSFSQLKKIDIRAIVIDKDNCITIPGKLELYDQYEEKWRQMKNTFHKNNLLIVSNSSGLLKTPYLHEADLLEKNLDVPVLRHEKKKPLCHFEVMKYLKKHTQVTSPSQIVVIGDRLFTDILMGNKIGAWTIWIQNGIIKDIGLLHRIERTLFFFLKYLFSPSLPLEKL